MIPGFQNLTLPVLRTTSDGNEKAGSAIIEAMIGEFQLTDAERSALLPSGRQSIITNRVHWAITYLAKCALLERTRRGHVKITQRGLDVLKENPPRIDLKYLARFPELEEFRAKRSAADDVGTQTEKQGSPDAYAAEIEVSSETPDERLRRAHQEIEAALKANLIDRVISEPPAFFEQLVVDVLVAMGYGGTHGRSSRLGGSGDGGVDGVIDQDALGLDRVYVQAKRFADKSVGSGDIRNFFGSLVSMRANKGVFITTSKFTKDAREQAEKFTMRIVLIDGDLLGSLMVQYGVGVRLEDRFEVKRLDEDYFSWED